MDVDCQGAACAGCDNCKVPISRPYVPRPSPPLFKDEQAAQDRAEREKSAREKSAREQAARDKSAREQAERERSVREQSERERDARERAARERAAREQAAREQAASDRAAREQAARDQAQKQRDISDAIRLANDSIIQMRTWEGGADRDPIVDHHIRNFNTIFSKNRNNVELQRLNQRLEAEYKRIIDIDEAKHRAEAQSQAQAEAQAKQPYAIPYNIQQLLNQYGENVGPKPTKDLVKSALRRILVKTKDMGITKLIQNLGLRKRGSKRISRKRGMRSRK
jgi:hypothetical protein